MDYSQQKPAGYPHPPPPNYNQTAPTVIVTQPYHNPALINVGPEPCQLTCPSCRATVLTNIKHEPNTNTHLAALCLFCCICWPCVCLPYCMDSCQNANHYCPNCNAFIGTYAS